MGSTKEFEKWKQLNAGDYHQHLKDQKDLLWHYTDFAAFESILRNNELWATDYRFMNDSTELLHALKFCFPPYNKSLSHVAKIIGQYLESTKPLPSAEVLSFSREFDSLEQWRGYSRHSVGVALGFDAAVFERVATHFGFKRLECIYTKQDKYDAIHRQIFVGNAELKKFEGLTDREHDLAEGYEEDEAAAEECNLVEGGQEARALAITYHLQMQRFMNDIVLAFKDDSFSKESEVRFASPFRDFSSNADLTRTGNHTPERAFRQRDGAIIPYSKLPLSVEGVESRHPLKAVLFGPVAQSNVLQQRARMHDFTEWFHRLTRARPATIDPPIVAFSKVPLRG